MADLDKPDTNNSVELKMEREGEGERTEVKKSSRRPDIDLIRIALTWGILLYHTVLIYAPYLPYYVKIVPDQVKGWHFMTGWFIISMNAWNMPMFFFLSGISAFFGLKKRNENQFRGERIHRLLVPALFLSLTSSFFNGLDYYSKLSPNCQKFSEFKNISRTECEMFYPVRENETYGEYVRKMFLPVPSPSQGWFLCYLFVFSQLFTPLFLLVHPNHQDDEKFGCLKKPLSRIMQVICCINFFGFLTPTHGDFVRGVKFWLGHPVKLALGNYA